MVTEQEYHQLLAQTKSFCIHHKIDHLEFTHDVLLGGYMEGVSLQKFFNKAYTQMQSGAKIVSLERINGQGEVLTVYKQCKCCELVLPDWEFPDATRNKCLRCDDRSAKSQKKSRDTLADRYIIDVLKKNGYAKIEITPKLIEEKRQKLLNKRSKKLSL